MMGHIKLYLWLSNTCVQNAIKGFDYGHLLSMNNFMFCMSHATTLAMLLGLTRLWDQHLVLP